MPIDTPTGRRLISFDAIEAQSSANSTGFGTEVNLGAAYSKHSMQVVTAASSFTVQLQGSLAGGSSDWAVMGIIATSSGGASGSIVTSTEQGITAFAVTRVRAAVITIPTTAVASGTLNAVIAVSQ